MAVASRFDKVVEAVSKHKNATHHGTHHLTHAPRTKVLTSNYAGRESRQLADAIIGKIKHTRDDI
jgi:hypothetical protein